MKPAAQPRHGMTRWQLVAFLILILLPLLLFGGVGAWALWDRGHLLWLSWTLPVCWALAWLMIRSSRRFELPLPEVGSHEYWTPHDLAALAIVAVEQSRLEGVSGEQLMDIKFFRDRTVDLATKLARHYHPKSADPLANLSVVEILTVAQLVAEDLEDWFQKYVPGSHLITVGQWRLLAQAPDWWKTATNVGWIASVAMNPLLGLSRYAASKVFVDPVTKQIQAGLLGSFFTIYMRLCGQYLIELNSGRLRGGAARYRQAMQRLEPLPVSQATEPQNVVPESVVVTIAIIGQVKAGKSSLTNCLLGSRQAVVDVLPQTKNVDRYELRLDESRDRLILLDTPGYADSGATGEQISATREAVRNSDLILLVLSATSPAKQADAKMLEDLTSWFRTQNRLKPPPIIGVVSKIDGLRPIMEWSPPYDWERPSRPKEQSIREAMDYASQSMGTGLRSLVPICSDRDRGRVYGIEEWLLPMMILQLDESRAVSLIRSLHAEYDREKLQKTLSQFIQAGKRITEEAGKQLAKVLRETLQN